DVGGLGGLTAGVGVHLGVEDEDVDILAGGQDVVQTAVADVVGPAVAAEDPHGLLVQVVLLVQDLLGQLAGVALAEGLALGLQLLAKGADLGVVGGAQLLHGAEAVLQGGHIGLGSGLVALALGVGVQPLLGGVLQLGTGPLHLQQLLGLGLQAVADGLLAQIQTQAVLGVVLE